MWAKIMRDPFGATSPKALMLRFHTQTGGSTLTAQQPQNNIVRTALQAMAAVLGGTQSLHTNSFDEALALPTEDSARIALRTQQIIGYESGVTAAIDPLAGSYYVETLTNEIEKRATDYLGKIDAMGGMLKAIERGFVQQEIQNAAYEFQKSVDSKEQLLVGVNAFQVEQEKPVTLQTDRPRTGTAAGRASAGLPRQARPGKGCQRRAQGGRNRAQRRKSDAGHRGSRGEQMRRSAKSAMRCARSSASTRK